MRGAAGRTGIPARTRSRCLAVRRPARARSIPSAMLFIFMDVDRWQISSTSNMARIEWGSSEMNEMSSFK